MPTITLLEPLLLLPESSNAVVGVPGSLNPQCALTVAASAGIAVDAGHPRSDRQQSHTSNESTHDARPVM